MIRIEGLQIDLNEFHLRDINLEVRKNDFFVLMGPTGAGKTVLLEGLAGLVSSKSGKIFIDGREVTKLPPEKRGVSLVYQDYALFPHLTVLENIRYGLHFHKMDSREVKPRLDMLLETLNLHHLQKRFPTYLSGGEKQRVSLARALIVKPGVLLLDEPLSSLDPGFREDVRAVLKRIHQSSEVTFLMVTHNFSEALSLASRAAVMNNGRIEQIGPIEDIFQRPSSMFVADFVGMKNLFPAEFQGTQARLDPLQVELGRIPWTRTGYVAIRPEDIVLSKEEFSSSMRNRFRGRVTALIDQGFYHEVHIQVENVTFKSLITKKSLFELGIHEGMALFLSFKSTAIHTF